MHCTVPVQARVDGKQYPPSSHSMDILAPLFLAAVTGLPGIVLGSVATATDVDT